MYIIGQEQTSTTFASFGNLIPSITSASTAVSGYPKENLLTEYTKQVYKSASNTTTIELGIIPFLTDLAILNTNAESGTITIQGTGVWVIDQDYTFTENTTTKNLVIYNGATVTVASGVTVTINAGVTTITLDLDFYRNNRIVRNYLLSFNQVLTDATVTLTLETTLEYNVYCGLIYAGQSIKYGDTEYGINDKYQDASITDISENGTVSYTAGTTRIDKTFPVFCTKDQYEQFRLDYLANQNKKVIYLGARSGIYADTYMKYGVLKPPSNPKEERGRYLRFEVDMMESY